MVIVYHKSLSVYIDNINKYICVDMYSLSMGISAQIVHTYYCQEGTAPAKWRRPPGVKNHR